MIIDLLQKLVDLQLDVERSDHGPHLAARPCAPRRGRDGNVPEQVRITRHGDWRHSADGRSSGEARCGKDLLYPETVDASVEVTLRRSGLGLEFIQWSFTEETKMTPQTVQYKELSESGNHDREFGPV